jgi:hypothetical protein
LQGASYPDQLAGKRIANKETFNAAGQKLLSDWAVWDDFNAQPDTIYDYEFHPFRGTPANLDRTAAPIPIRIRTEPLFSTQEHDVFMDKILTEATVYEGRGRKG